MASHSPYISRLEAEAFLAKLAGRHCVLKTKGWRKL